MLFRSNPNSYLNSDFFNSFNTTDKTNATTSLFTNAAYYNTLNKYAIANKYTNNSTASTKDTVTGTEFLSNYDKTYSDLSKASANLKDSLKTDISSSDASTIIAATQKYVDAYNSTNKFLNDNTGLNTSRLNQAKSSLSVIATAGSADLSSIGITKNLDGSLNLNTDKLKTALSSNTNFATKTLNSLTIRSDVSTQMAQSTSKPALLKEFNSNLTSNTGISSEHDVSYTEFLSMAKNQTSLKNYYFSLSSLGIFMDISL